MPQAITLDQAQAIIDVTLDKAAELKLQPLTVAVLDAGGHLKALARQDNTSTLRPEVAQGKGASARPTTTYYQLHRFSATTTTIYLLPERVGAAAQGGACEGCPRQARGRRGRRSLRFQVPPAMGAWHACWGRSYPETTHSQSSWGASEREQGAAPVGYMNLENLMFSSWVRM